MSEDRSVWDSITRLIDQVQALGVGQTEMNGHILRVGDRLALLEKIVYGACAIILIAVVTAIISGAVIIPNARVLQQLNQLRVP